MIRLPGFIRTSIQNKVFASFLAIMVLLLAEIIASFVIIDSLGKASDKILKMNYNSVTSSMRMMDYLEEIQREFIIANSSSLGGAPLKMSKAQSNFAQWLGRAKDNITETGEKRVITQIDSLYSLYQQSIQLAFLDPEKAPGYLLEAENLRTKIRHNCLELQRINQDAMFRKSNAAQMIARRGSITLILMTILVLCLGIALSWGLSKRIVRPILKLKDATQQLANGDYSIKLESDSSDELGILSSEFDAMAAKLWEFNQFNIRGRLAEQQKVESILANIQEGIFFIGADYNILDANTAALNTIKMERGEVIGHHFLEIIKQDKLFADLKTCLEIQKSIVYELRDNVLSFTRDKKTVYLEYFFTPVLSSQKELLGALFLLRDITNLKELDRLKSEFVMIVSHELKTPLTSINMSIDLLKESLGQSPKAEDLELINIAKEEITRLRMLISDLLDFRLPDLDGMEILRKYKLNNVIMITAHGTIDNAVEAMKLGCVDYLRKPFELEVVRKVVRELLERKHISYEQGIKYESLIQLSKLDVQARHFRLAIDKVKQALEIKPESSDAYNILGVLHEILDEIPLAVKAYQRAIDLDRNNSSAKENLDRMRSLDQESGLKLRF